MTPEWIATITAAIGLAGAFIGVIWKFTMSVDRLTVAVERIEESLERGDEKMGDHANRITRLETWRGYHDNLHEYYDPDVKGRPIKGEV